MKPISDLMLEKITEFFFTFGSIYKYIKKLFNDLNNYI